MTSKSTLPDHLLRPTLPIAYVQLMVELLESKGVSRMDFLAGLPEVAAAIDCVGARVSGATWGEVILHAQAMTEDPGLGYAYGLRMRPSVHGILGYAAMTALSMRHALELLGANARIRQVHFDFALDARSDPAQVVVKEKVPIPMLRAFLYENLLVGLARCAATLVGRDIGDLPELELCFDFEEPPYFAAWKSRLPRVRFLHSVNAMRLPRSYLTLRPALADQHALHEALSVCERELSLSPGEIDDIVMRIRASLCAPGGGYRDVEEVARRLHVSSRTLKRRLNAIGTSFSELVLDARLRDACALLADHRMTIRDIAERVGYANPANFTRAFGSWTGMSPTEYRGRTAPLRTS